MLHFDKSDTKLMRAPQLFDQKEHVATATLTAPTPTLTAAALGAPRPKPRVVFLDVIRGLAALFVLLQHTNEVVSHQFLFWSFRWFNAGRMGVAAFFLVSGFVIPFSLERVNSLKSFWVSRLFRLYPLYWFSLLVVVIFHFCGSHAFTEGFESHWKTVVLYNVTMFQEFLGKPHAVGLYWTLTLEMIFYIAFSVLFAFGVNKRSLLWAWIGLGLLVLIGLADRNGIERGMHHKLPVARFALLVIALIGTVIFRFHNGLVSKRQLGWLAVGAVVALAIAMRLSFRSPFTTSDTEEEWSAMSMFSSYAAAGVLFAVVYLFRDKQFPFFLRWLGTISYSVYLLHYPTWLLLMKIPHDGYPQGFIWIFTVLSATCVVASLTYLFVEEPAIELGKRLLRKPKESAHWQRV
jgi:peptidoglycan/LPS O-acetylase OafA/YrhL